MVDGTVANRLRLGRSGGRLKRPIPHAVGRALNKQPTQKQNRDRHSTMLILA